MATGTGGENRQTNEAIKNEIEKLIENNDDRLLILGDFNAHVGHLGPQEEDENGRRINSLIENNGLTLLNSDMKCKGEITWQGNHQVSAIDFVIVDNKAYENFAEMNIDENKEIYDLSDHNLIECKFENFYSSQKVNRTTKEIVWNLKEDKLKQYLEDMEKRCYEENITNIEEYNSHIKAAGEKYLKKIRIKKTDTSGKVMNKPWMNDNILKEIKERKSRNRKIRNNVEESNKEQLENEYKEQKDKVSKMVREAITLYEKRNSEEIANNRNKVWENIKKLRGDGDRDEELIIYDENGDEIKPEDTIKEINKFWNTIYRKYDVNWEVWNEENRTFYINNKTDFQNAYQGRNYNKFPEELDDHLHMIIRQEEIKYPKQLNEHMVLAMPIQKELNEMRKPDLNVDKVRQTLKKLKAKKAAGPDTLKPELYKELAKSEVCTNKLSECLQKEIETNQMDGKSPELLR